MDKKYSLPLLIILIVSLFLLVYNLKQKKEIIIWSWERPDNLQFLTSSSFSDYNISVAFYALGVEFKDGKFKSTERLNPLKIDANTKRFPVIRIDNFDTPIASSNDKRIDLLAKLITSTCLKYNESECQVDFDVRQSEVESYKTILNTIRMQLPSKMKLSITALVSWCRAGSWVDVTPVDYVVPMFYDLGSDKTKIQNGDVDINFLKATKCQNYVSVSRDDDFPNLKFINNKKIYLWSNSSWTKDKVLNLLNQS